MFQTVWDGQSTQNHWNQAMTDLQEKNTQKVYGKINTTIAIRVEQTYWIELNWIELHYQSKHV